MNTIYLKVKIKSLAAEARIIRLEEQRAKRSRQTDLRAGLHHHRTFKVRQAARYAQLAYGYLRGRPYRLVERTTRTRASSATLLAEIKRFQPKPPDKSTIRDWLEQEADTESRAA